MAASEMTGNIDAPVQICLPEKLDTAAASSVHRDLARHQGSDLTLDFSDVKMVGGLCLQVLLNAQHHWAEGEHTITVANVVPDVEMLFVELGVTAKSLETGDVA